MSEEININGFFSLEGKVALVTGGIHKAQQTLKLHC